MPSSAKSTFGWLAMSSGILVGLYCLWMSSIRWLSDGDDWLSWRQDRSECLGWGILGLRAICGSVILP